MAITPVKFRDRPRTTAVQQTDILPLSRDNGDGTFTTMSIAWSNQSAQIVSDVATARQAMVDGFTQQTTNLNNAVSDLQNSIKTKPVVYNNTAAVAAPVLWTGNKTLTTAGTVQFFLTTDGTATGTALFTTIYTFNFIVNDAATLYTFGYALSTDKKTLTVTSNKSATPLLSLLGINILGAPVAAPIGTSISGLVIGS